MKDHSYGNCKSVYESESNLDIKRLCMFQSNRRVIILTQINLKDSGYIEVKKNHMFRLLTFNLKN